jgi:hypothetical protein
MVIKLDAAKSMMAAITFVIIFIAGYVVGGWSESNRDAGSADLPPLITIIDMKKTLSLLQLIADKKEDKAVELLYLLIDGHLTTINFEFKNAHGSKLNKTEKSEVCSMLNSLRGIERSKIASSFSIREPHLLNHIRENILELGSSCNQWSQHY